MTAMVVLTMLLAVQQHIGLMCPGHAGHLNPTATLGAELKQRGHRVTLISTPQGAATAKRHGLEFAAIGIPEFKSGALEATLEKEGRLRGLAAFRHTIQLFKKEEKLVLRDLPSLIERANIDALCVDQLLPAAMGIADARQMPYAVLCNALPLHLEPAVPPCITTWGPPNGSKMQRLRNRLANVIIMLAAAPLYAPVNKYRAQNGLDKYKRANALHVGMIQVAQIPSLVDFPRSQLPGHFFYTLPWHGEHRDLHVPFPWERLDGRPLLYISLGTVQNRLESIYLSLAEACRDLDVQVVMALGRRSSRDGAALADEVLPPNVIAVNYAPQLALLQRASVVVTHAGMNTALEALAHGRPMVAIPVANDQPGIAARLAHLGVAEVVPVAKARPRILKKAIIKVLGDPTYRQAARHLQRRLRDGESPTLKQTAELIEIGLGRSEPLMRDDPDVQRILRSAKSRETWLRINNTTAVCT